MKIRRAYMPFGKPDFSQREIDAAARVIRSGWVGMGRETIAFEHELEKHLGAPHVVSVNSCTSALFLSLLCHGVGPGDEVVCPSLTWCSTASAVLYLGAKPVFCDVDPATLCAPPEFIARKITRRTKAVILVHLAGLAADVAALRAVLPARIAIVEDAAHAFGAKYPDGKKVGSSGNLTCFSFYANKNLSTGEGGAIALFSKRTADRLRSLRQNGMPVDAWKRFSFPKTIIRSELIELGYKMNYTDLQAAIGRVQLKRQAQFRAARLAVARRYCLGLAGLPITLQPGILSDEHARHLFLVQLPLERMRTSRNQLLLGLRQRNIGATVHYAPLHRMPLFRSGRGSSLPNTEALAERILTLPISASLTEKDADYVVEALRYLAWRI